MPTDARGKFQLNNQKVRHSDAMHAMDTGGQSGGSPTVADEGKEKVHATIHDHGDGTGHTEMHDGSRREHPDIEALKQLLDQADESDRSEDMADKNAAGGDISEGWD